MRIIALSTLRGFWEGKAAYADSRDRVAGTRIVVDLQPAAVEERARRDLEVFRLRRAPPQVNDAHAALHFVERVVDAFEHGLEPPLQGLDVAGEHAGLKIGEQVVYSEQRLERHKLPRRDQLLDLEDAILKKGNPWCRLRRFCADMESARRPITTERRSIAGRVWRS